MGDKGLDFKHKEVINISNAKRLRICARCNSRFKNRCNNIYNCALKENSSIAFIFNRKIPKKTYTTRKNQQRTGYILKEKFIYDVICKVEL